MAANHLSNNRSTKSTNHSVSQPASQPVSQSVNQSINQPINQSIQCKESLQYLVCSQCLTLNSWYSGTSRVFSFVNLTECILDIGLPVVSSHFFLTEIKGKKRWSRHAFHRNHIHTPHTYASCDDMHLISSITKYKILSNSIDSVRVEGDQRDTNGLRPRKNWNGSWDFCIECEALLVLVVANTEFEE